MFPFYNNATLPMLPFGMRKNRRVRTLDNRGIYELCTTGVVENTADEYSVDYGVNPCVWRSLPNEFVAIWKVKHPATTNGADLPANVVVPTYNLSSTVNSSNSNSSVNKIPVLDNKSTRTTGKDINVPVGSGNEAQQSYTTEHWIYVNKCTGTFRLMGVTAQEAPTPVA